MPNPYGMTEVDIPGILAQFEQRKDRRLQQLRTQQEIQIADRELENENKTAAAWGRFLGPQGGVGAAYAQPGQPTPSTPESATAAPQDYDPWNDEAAQEELVNNLLAVDREGALQIRAAFQNHSAAERKRAAENWKMIGSAAFQLRQLPPQERAAELQRMTPMLQSLGIEPQMLAQVDLSDRGLESIVDQSRDIEQVIDGRMAKTIPVQAGGEIRTVTQGSPYPQFGANDIPPEAIEALRRGEGTPEQFDEMFGPGASQRVMTATPQSAANTGPILQNALRAKRISAADASAVIPGFGPNGAAEFAAWARQNGIRVER